MSIANSTPPVDADPTTLTITATDVQLMRAEVEKHSPVEACGLLIGHVNGNHATAIHTIPMKNVSPGFTRFRMDGEEQLAVFNRMEDEGFALVGIYHSHTSGPAEPSATDIQEAYYPEAVQLIWSNAADDWSLAAFTIQEGKVSAAILQIVESK